MARSAMGLFFILTFQARKQKIPQLTVHTQKILQRSISDTALFLFYKKAKVLIQLISLKETNRKIQMKHQIITKKNKYRLLAVKTKAAEFMAELLFKKLEIRINVSRII